MKAALLCLLVCVPATAVAQQAGRKGTTLGSIGLQGYSLVLVTGDMQAPGSSANAVPGAARKALADMEAFLPFKRYQLIDAAWMLCCGSLRNSTTGRIRGPVDRDYSYTIETMSLTDEGKLMVRFTMRDDGDGVAVGGTGRGVSGGGRSAARPALSETARAEYSRQLYEVTKERDDAIVQLQSVKQKYDVGMSTTTELEAAWKRMENARSASMRCSASWGEGRLRATGVPRRHGQHVHDRGRRDRRHRHVAPQG